MMRTVLVFSLFLGCIGAIAGCSRDRSVAGGTRGTLHNGTTGVRDVRIEVYPIGGAIPIGFGVTRDGGEFELYEPTAQRGLDMPPGNYAFSLESVGPEPLALRPELRDPQRTPLRRPWNGTETGLELSLP